MPKILRQLQGISSHFRLSFSVLSSSDTSFITLLQELSRLPS